jgi:hypothetical protein
MSAREGEPIASHLSTPKLKFELSDDEQITRRVTSGLLKARMPSAPRFFETANLRRQTIGRRHNDSVSVHVRTLGLVVSRATGHTHRALLLDHPR